MITQNLLQQTTHDDDVEDVIVSEPCRNHDGDILATDSTAGAAKISGTPPSLTMFVVEDWLGNLVHDARGGSLKLIAGNLNAWAIERGSRENNAKGRSPLEAFAQLDTILVKEGRPDLC